MSRTDANYIEFRGVRYATAAAFGGKPHNLIGVELEICSKPQIRGLVVAVDVMRSVALIQYKLVHDPDELEPVYSIMTFDGVKLLMISDTPAAPEIEASEPGDIPPHIQKYVEAMRAAAVYHIPAQLRCDTCGWIGGALEAVIEPFFYKGAPLAMREGDDYKCPKCTRLILHHITRMS